MIAIVAITIAVVGVGCHRLFFLTDYDGGHCCYCSNCSCYCIAVIRIIMQFAKTSGFAQANLIIPSPNDDNNRACLTTRESTSQPTIQPTSQPNSQPTSQPGLYVYKYINAHKTIFRHFLALVVGLNVFMYKHLLQATSRRTIDKEEYVT
uniref:Uncharacterized protein n=1 Tax=Glossina brevipalpis TaxID=37001 RepID=A0A1A9WHM7_9MUSC